MATYEERTTKHDEVKSSLEELSEIDPKNLSRREELSKNINFSDAVPFFTEMLDVIKELNERDLSRLSTQQLTRIFSACNTLSLIIKKVNDFDLNVNTPLDVCSSIIVEIKNTYDTVMDPLLLPLAFTATQATDYAKIEREAKGYHTTMKTESEEFSKKLVQYEKDANKALGAVKEQAAEAGVSSNAHIFLKDSENHKKIAKNWLISTIVLTSITVLTAIGFVIISFYYTPASTASAIQYGVSKLILLSTMSFGIYWCAKNYKSTKHNETLNKHRANALMTFRAFVEGSTDIKVREVILLQAAQAAFVNRSTGYENTEKEIPTINPIVEILSKSAKNASSEV